MEWLIFGFLAVWLLASVFGTLFLKNPVHVILAFLSVILAIAGMFLHLGAELLAGLQLIIYAVAIIVFYVLVITTIPWEKVKKFEGIYKREALIAIPFLLVSFGAISYMILKGNFYISQKVPTENNIVSVGKSLFTTYLFPFEVASVILLTAMIGAIILGRKEE
ncbi:NADH-quinone oxidoreductase subunit J family protein [Thermocrinis jamiesonii]|uniref:NADH-quinone oxidoreductase subunit J family protein n=1 Tax=Thermocrinis jamiesonii TaxID=1302351 RepID=UPI0004950F8D|nr:NADH-quinone oxidoreductase subunit J [Thermocrinis jamiesonii]